MAKSQLEFEATVSATKIQALLQQLESGAQGAAKAINDAFGGTVRKTIVFDEVRDERGVKRLIATEKERLSIADQIINRQRKIKDLQEGSATSLRQQENRLRQQRDSIARYRDSVGSVGGLLRKQTDEWTAANTQLSAVTRQLALAEASGFWQQLKVATRAQGFINVLNGVNQIVQGLQAATIIVGQFQAAINGVINSAAEVQSFALTFRAIGVGAAGGTAALQEASRIALGLGSDLRTVQDGFRQLSPVVLNIGGSMDDVSLITETLSSRFAAFGISGDRARRVMNGIIQAFAKGKLQAEELTQQISEADPAFKTDFAEALFASRDELGKLGKEVDGSVASLEKLVKAGKITGDVLLKVLPGLSKSSLLFGRLGPTASTALAALEKGNVTIDQVRANLNTLNELSLRKFAESATPLINAFLRIQAVTTDFFTRLSQSEGAKAFARLGATAFDIFANLADGLFVVIEGLASVVGAIKPLIDLLTAFPGLLQGIGLLFLGNLIKPLGLFERRIEKTKAAWATFAGFIRSSTDPAKQEISVITNSIGRFSTELSKSLKQGGVQNSFSNITTAAEQAITSVESVGSRTANQIDASINKIETKIARLREKLAAETAGQVTTPTTPEGRGESTLTALIAQNEAKIKELQNSAATIRQENAGAINKVAIDLNQLSKVIDESVSGLSKFGKISESSLKYEPMLAAERDEPPPFERFSDQAIKNYAKYLVESVTAQSKAIASGSLEELNATTNENLLDKTQKQIDDFVSRSVAVTKSVKAQLIDLQAEFESRNIDFSIDVIGEQSVNSDLQSIENQIRSLRNEAQLAKAELAALAKAGGSDAGRNGFAEKETKRQKKLGEQIKKSADELQGLYAQQAQQEAAGIQARRQQVGFEPGSVDRLQQLIEIQKKADRELYKNQERMFTPEKIAEDRKKLYAELAQIEKNRERDIATFGEQAFPGGYRTEDIDKLRKKLLDLKDIENDIAIEAQTFANQQNDVNKIFAEGSREGANLEDRQKAIALATRLANTAIAENNKKIDELKNRYRTLKAERKDILQEQRTSTLVGPVPKDDPILADLTANREQSRQTRREIAALRLENIQAIRKQKELNQLQIQNTSISNRQTGSIARLGNAFRNVLTGGANIAGRALGGLGNGLKGLAGLIDPLTALFIASGIASRLYAEGNRDASEAAAKYADQLKILNQAQLDLVPTQQSVTKNLTIFQKGFEALAVSTVRVGDAISGVFSGIFTEVGFFLEGIRNGLTSAGKEVSNFGNIVGSLALTSGTTALGAFIGSLFGPGPGTLIGAAIGAAVGVVSSLAISSDAASIALTKLQKKLDEVEKGSRETAAAVESLAFGLISEIKIPKAGPIAGDDLARVKAGSEAIKKSVELTKAELTQTKGLRIANNEQRKKEEASIKSLTKQKEIAAARDAAIADEIARTPAGDAARSSELIREGKRSKTRLIEIEKALQAARAASKSYNDQNAELGDTERRLTQDLERQQRALEAIEKLRKRAEESTVKYANSVNELNEAIRILNEENAGLDLTNKEDLKTLDENLNRIKAIQAALELAGKTRLEVRIEVDKLQSDLRQAQIVIDVPAGPIREVRQLSEKINTDIRAAGAIYAQNIQNVESLRKGNNISQVAASELVRKYGLEYATAIRGAAAELIDKGRQFRDDLESATRSLQNLKLSNPNFFTPEELQANAQEIENEFIKTLEKVRRETDNYNFFPRLEGNTTEEILASKARFIETRKEADRLNKSIENISGSIDLIVSVLTGLNAKQIQELKKNGLDINKLLERSGQSLEGAGAVLTGAAPRIGEVVGRITAGGKELVLYFDKVTGKIEEITAAEFAARQEADRLATSGQNAIQAISAGADAAGTSFGNLADRVGEIQGVISANGKTIVLYYDNLTNKLEQVDGATFNRLSKEKVVTKEYEDQLEAVTALFKSQEAASSGVAPGKTPANGLIDMAKVASDLTLGAKSALDALVKSEAPVTTLADGLSNAASFADSIAKSFNSLDGKTVTINVSTLPQGRWMGGDVTGGTSYQVNELGKEGFLSAAGKLTPINKPSFGIWRAPSSGTVVPAHIMDMINVPQAGIKSNNVNAGITQKGNQLQQVVRAMLHGMSSRSNTNAEAGELARVQAHQARQIGKLASAVGELAHKDWNVNVGVRNTGSAAYLDMMNRFM